VARERPTFPLLSLVYLKKDAAFKLVDGENVTRPDFELVLGQRLLLRGVVEVLVRSRLHWHQIERPENLEQVTQHKIEPRGGGSDRPLGLHLYSRV